jgi:hypothetical protein
MLQFPILTFWSEDDLYKLQVQAVSWFLRCDSPRSVEASLEFARYLNSKGLDSDNYPLFLEMLRNENGFVVEALVGREKAFDLFTRVQPNPYILDFCFQMLRQYSVGGVHDLTLEIIFGILYRTYHSAKEGYMLHPLTVEDVNSIGKFLDKSRDQNNSINRFILDILTDISEYRSINNENPAVDRVSSHATAIRNAFFDRKKKMASVMPSEILVRKEYSETLVRPRKQKKFTDTEKTGE